MKCPRRLLSIRPLLLCLPVAWVLATAAADVPPPPAHRPGCPSKCGNVEIPYPFGIGDQCAIHGGFGLDCTRVNGTDRPFSGPFEVTSISVPDAKASMKMNISWQCFDNQMKRDWYTPTGNFTYTPYRFSTQENKIFVISCNSLAYITSEYYSIGCSSECYSDPRNMSSCSAGSGCCEANVPVDMGYYRAYFNTDYNSTGCAYAVVMEAKAFSYITAYRYSRTLFWNAYNGTVPVVFDWVIGPYTCEDAKKNVNSSYACVSDKSECVNSSNQRQAYRCKCLNGYQGNPYVNGGCTDINECLHNTTNICMSRGATCQNTEGSFSCLCPPGKEMVNNICLAKQNSISAGLSIGIGVSSGAVLVLLVLAGIFITKKRAHLKTKRQKQKFFKQNRGQLLQQLVAQRADIAERMIIPLEEIQKATNNFDKARKLGDGGHSIVYKGILSDLHVVAIKKSKITLQSEIDEFINEVAILSQISHINVVKLFGCCLETEVPLLIYEFVSNGTLYHHLHVMDPRSLSWNDRLRIAKETAKAIAYLHSAVSIPIIHRDIKSANILLDDTLTSKVADFGASRHIPFDQTGVTTRVQGTIGYLDPSYYYTRQLTKKSDVYSFGVILVELLTRKKPFSYMSSGQEGLVTHFTSLLSLDRLVEILDVQVMEGGKQVEEVATLAATCVKLNPDERPTMRKVEMALEAIQAKEHVFENVAWEKFENTITRRSEPEGRTSRDMTSRKYSLEEEFLLSSRYPR